MPCQQCGKITYHPYHWATNRVQRDECDSKQVSQMFGNPGDGRLFTEEL